MLEDRRSISPLAAGEVDCESGSNGAPPIVIGVSLLQLPPLLLAPEASVGLGIAVGAAGGLFVGGPPP